MNSLFKNKAFVGEAALFLAAFFWGLSFIFQRQAMDFMTPFAYMGLRFTFAALFLLPFAVSRFRKQLALSPEPRRTLKISVLGSMLAGTLIFAAGAFQQYGIIWTTVAKTGFITSLYVVLVPLILLFFGRRVLRGEAVGAILALIGLFLLSFNESLSLSFGDSLVLFGAVVWALHVIYLSWLSPKMDSFVLGTGQALACGLLGLLFMVVRSETPSLEMIHAAIPALLGGSILSVTIGFTLQIYGQRDASPAATAIILQLEAVFAAFFGWVLLGESMTGRMLLGAAVMLAGVLLSQLWTTPAVTASAATDADAGAEPDKK